MWIPAPSAAAAVAEPLANVNVLSSTNTSFTFNEVCVPWTVKLPYIIKSCPLADIAVFNDAEYDSNASNLPSSEVAAVSKLSNLLSTEVLNGMYSDAVASTTSNLLSTEVLKVFSI